MKAGLTATVVLLCGCGSGAPGTDSAAPADAGVDALALDAAPAADRALPDFPTPHDLSPFDGEPADAGQALGKLCHELNRSGLPVELTLELGEPATARITARTGVCAPPAGMPCQPIPVGLVPIRLLEGDKVLVTRLVTLVAGAEYAFQPLIANNQVVIAGGPINGVACSTLDFPPPDSGAGDAVTRD